MIYEYSKNDKWRYAIIRNLIGGQVGVKFYRHNRYEPSTFKVLFAGQNKVCMEWANFTRDNFFDKYSRNNRARITVSRAEEYLLAQQTELVKRKRLNLRIVE